MLTIPRIKRFIRAFEMDDDEIMGEDKAEVLSALLKIGRKYHSYFKLCSNDALIEHLKSLFKKGLPNEIYEEAINIIADAIDVDSRENGLPIALYRNSNRDLIINVVREHEQDAHNLLIVDYAFGEKRYIPDKNKPKKKKQKSSLADEDWSKDNLSEEEGLDEIEPI